MSQPVLSYATRDPHPRLVTLAALILWMWVLIDLVFGLLMALGGMISLDFKPPDRLSDSVLALLFTILGIATFAWGIRTAMLALRLVRHIPGAAILAWKSAWIAELACYLALLLILTFAIRDRAWTDQSKIWGYFIGILLYMPLPLCVTGTRYFLKYLMNVQHPPQSLPPLQN